MRRFKSFLLILIALWLPIQAAAAVTMPFCRHAAEQAVEQAVAAAAHCHEQTADAATATAVDCDNCAICHLATTGFLLAATEALPPLAMSILVPKPDLVAASHIPEPPQQPPRR